MWRDIPFQPLFLVCILISSKHSTIQRTRLEAAYKALATGLNERMFSQLEEEVETEDQESEHMCLQLSPDPKMDTNLDLEQEVLFQRDSGSPMEASPADQPPQADAVPQTQESSLSKTTSVPWNGQLYTLSRLVMEPDSQASSQCSKVSEELETEARVEEAPQTLALSNKRDSQCPVTDQEVSIPAPKRHRRTNRINRRYLYLFFSFPGKWLVGTIFLQGCKVLHFSLLLVFV